MAYIVGTVKNGELETYIKLIIKDRLKDLPDGLMKMTIEPYVPGRTNEQLRYYRVEVLPKLRNAYLKAGCPLTENEMHEVLLAKFAPSKVITQPDGRHMVITKRTRSSADIGMSTEEMSDFLQGIIAEAAKFGIDIEPPYGKA